jgi:hypothetical protein
MTFELTEENFTMYAIKNYDNPYCKGMDEFLDDLKRFKYIKRLLRKHNVGKELKERLILNHIIVLGNLFGIEATTKMLFFKIEKKFWPQIKSFLVFLNYMPIKIIVSPGVEILEKDIEIDEIVLENLKKI